MTISAPDASDVPGFFDCIINGQGYVFANTVDQSLPFRVQRAAYSYTPTFVERQNVSGAYGDNQQDFFLTASQNDWSLGDGQRFSHKTVEGSDRSYWRGDNVNIATPGQVSIKAKTASFAAAAAPAGNAFTYGLNSKVAFATATNLYTIDNAGAIVDLGAHGLGNTPQTMTYDGNATYISTTSAGTVGIRRYLAGFTTFSATGVDAMAFLPAANTLYGFRILTADFVSFSTAGVVASIFTWRGANGAVRTPNGVKLLEFGNKLLLLLRFSDGSYLYQYDGGAAPTLLAQFPRTFTANDFAQLFGSVVFISGTADGKAAIYAYSNGAVELLWKSNYTVFALTVGISPLGSGIAFGDSGAPTPALRYYDLATGAISTIGTVPDKLFLAKMAVSDPTSSTDLGFLLLTGASSTVYVHPDASTSTSATMYSSLFDFDNALTKLMRGIKVDFDSATDGNGGTVDIAYRVGDVDGAYTTLQTGAVSGTEYPITGVTGRSISVQVTLNKGTSTLGPVLKRVYARASPQLQTYRLREFILDCSGRDGLTHVRLRNGGDHPLDGQAQVTNLIAATVSATPISITDRFGTFTGIIEPGKTDFIEIRPEEYIVRVFIREV